MPATGSAGHCSPLDSSGTTESTTIGVAPVRGHRLDERRRNRPADVVAPINQLGDNGKVRVGVAVRADAGHQDACHLARR